MLACMQASYLLPTWVSAKQYLKSVRIDTALACKVSLRAFRHASRGCAGCAGISLLFCRRLFIIRREHSSGSEGRIGSPASHGRWAAPLLLKISLRVPSISSSLLQNPCCWTAKVAQHYRHITVDLRVDLLAPHQ